MYKRALVIITFLIAVGAARARAQQADAVTTKILNGTITGTIGGPVAGVCSATGYSAICPSGPANCSCLTIKCRQGERQSSREWSRGCPLDDRQR